MMHCAPASSCKNSFEPRNYIRAVAYRVAALKAENKRAMAENPRWISATEYSPCPLPIAWRQPIRVSVQPCSLTLVKTVLDRASTPIPQLYRYNSFPFYHPPPPFPRDFTGSRLFSLAPAPRKNRVYHVGGDFSSCWRLASVRRTG